MTFPTIHLNGTSPKDLLEDQMKAMQAVREAIDTLQQTGPHGRDYYLQSPGAFDVATTEHHERVLKLKGVLAELEALAEYVADRMGER